jgi:hypothetical protein
MNVFKNSWSLVKASAKVLQADKELIIFPILSAIGVFLITLTFAIPLLAGNMAEAFLGKAGSWLGLLVLFVYYIVQYSVIYLANTALVGAAMIRLRGGDPTVGDGFRIAFSKLLPILGYALIAATVGIILQVLSRNKNSLARILANVFGFAWNVATFLVVPILAVEDVGPIEAIRRSVSYLKRTWGEQLVGNFGVGAVFGLIIVGLILLAVPVIYLAAQAESLALLIGLIAVFVVLFAVVGLIQSTLTGIYTAAVYEYANSGKVGSFFDDRMVTDAFRQQK